MKTKPSQNITALTAALALSLTGIACAEEEHPDHKDHDHKAHAEPKKDDHSDHAHSKKIAGPHGGRILTSVEPHLEFFFTEDRKVKFTAVDDAGKAIPLGKPSVTVTGGSRSNPTRLSFTQEGNSLISDKAFPEGNMLPIIIQIKTTPDAKTVIEKFNLNLSDCPGCQHLEYACTCDHGTDGHEGHDH